VQARGGPPKSGKPLGHLDPRSLLRNKHDALGPGSRLLSAISKLLNPIFFPTTSGKKKMFPTTLGPPRSMVTVTGQWALGCCCAPGCFARSSIARPSKHASTPSLTSPSKTVVPAAKFARKLRGIQDLERLTGRITPRSTAGPRETRSPPQIPRATSPFSKISSRLPPCRRQRSPPPLAL